MVTSAPLFKLVPSPQLMVAVKSVDVSVGMASVNVATWPLNVEPSVAPIGDPVTTGGGGMVTCATPIPPAARLKFGNVGLFPSSTLLSAQATPNTPETKLRPRWVP